MKLFLSFLLIFILVAGCNSNKRINEDEFIKIYAKILLAKEKFNENTETFFNERKKIFNQLNITDEQFIISYEYYSSNPENWKEFLDKVIIYLENEKKKLN